MARISLYVPEELRARMDAVGDAVNWSDVARPALTTAVAAFEHRKGENMSTAIERLRASKQQADQHDKTQGNAHGRAWAEHNADYRTLRELSVGRKHHPKGDPSWILQCAIDPEDIMAPDDFDEFIRFPTGEDAPHDQYVVRPSLRSDEYLAAFIQGAVSFFEEVRKEVERD